MENVVFMLGFFFFKQKTAYDMRISDWSSDVCSSDLPRPEVALADPFGGGDQAADWPGHLIGEGHADPHGHQPQQQRHQDRKRVVSGKSVSVRLNHGGRRIIKKKKYSFATSSA